MKHSPSMDDLQPQPVLPVDPAGVGRCDLCDKSGPLYKLPWGPPPTVCADCASKHGYGPGGPTIPHLVMADLAKRQELGIKKYGVPLRPHNGRDGLRDLYEELLDAVQYLRQELYERDGS